MNMDNEKTIDKETVLNEAREGRATMSGYESNPEQAFTDAEIAADQMIQAMEANVLDNDGQYILGSENKNNQSIHKN